MGNIQIKTPFAEQAKPLLKEAIEREKKLVRDSLLLTDERIGLLTKQLGVDVQQVLAGKMPRTEENEMGLLELEGELEIRRSLAEALRNLESLEVWG